MIFHLFQRVGEHAVFERPMILLNVPFASSATQLINDLAECSFAKVTWVYSPYKLCCFHFQVRGILLLFFI